MQPTLAQDSNLSASLEEGWRRISSDPSMLSASIGIYVADASTGKLVFERNGRTGMLPASSQKVLTAIAALDRLGAAYQYETQFFYSGRDASGNLQGPLVVKGGGDPTLGSTRFASTSPSKISALLSEALKKEGIKSIKGGIAGLAAGFSSETIPDGWIWEDIGNYFGAGHGPINWHENTYSLVMRPGKREGDPVDILSTDPVLHQSTFENGLVTGPAGSGDRTVLYFSPGSRSMVVRGSIPCCTSVFQVSGAVLDPSLFTIHQLKRILGAEGEAVIWRRLPSGQPPLTPLLTIKSPALDTIIHAFLQKSINLYGEALVRSLSTQSGGEGSFPDGLTQLESYWKSKGIDPRMLNLHDGSGLSPLNRVAPEALARAILYARGRPWFPIFDRAMPLHEGIRMKSGTMTGVRSYAGYIRGREGREYAFAVILNNFSGPGPAAAARIREFVSLMR